MVNGVFAMYFYSAASVVFFTDFAIALKAILCLYVFVKAQRNKTKIFTDEIILRRFL